MQHPVNRYQGSDRVSSHGGSGDSYHRDPYPQQSIQDRYHGSSNNDRYGNSFQQTAGIDERYLEEHNEVLGSGNFEVIQGGTFYDGNEHYYDDYDYGGSNSDRRPPNTYDSEDNILLNFRDFADIKNDLLKYDQGYVPRY